MSKNKRRKNRKKNKIDKKIILVFSIVFIVFCSCFGIYYFLFPNINLKGGRKIVINYKDVYKEKGYSAKHMGKNITHDVKVSGSVNTNKLGTYDITYKVGSGLFKKKVVREVVVSDIEKPKLSINKDDIYVCPGSKYKVEKVKAYDNYDGDLTSKVKSKVLDDKVIYSVIDSNKNKRTITKKLFYKDIEEPKIELVGSDVSICVNEVYKEPGYNVSDNCDKKISAQVEGSVDNSLVGEYELTYKAVDKAGNKASAKRKVVVSDGDRNGVVYLTFDDGPNPGTTDVILNILKEEGVQATFFVTGYGPDELIKREADEGHTVALHTNVHDYQRVYASDDAYYADLQAIHDRVLNITGIDSRLIRFPGGASNTVSRRYSSGIMSRITQGVLERGYKYFDWNISSGDAGGTTDPNQVYANVVNGLRKDRVNNVLMHDSKAHTRDAIRNIIRYCKENGYEMKRLSNCSTPITQRVNN